MSQTAKDQALMDSIVTRHKASQMKRQLRNREQSIRRISAMTQELMRRPNTAKDEEDMLPYSGREYKPVYKRDKGHSPVNSNATKVMKSPSFKRKPEGKSPVKLQKRGRKPVPKKDSGAKEVVQEFHPDKLRRAVVSKKIVPISKHELKIVTRLNKRKLHEPQKGTKRSRNHSESTEISKSVSPSPKKTGHQIENPDHRQDRPEHRQDSPEHRQDSPEHGTEGPERSELSIEEMIRHSEDTQSLTDEDLLEILTCESPVWWEEQSDDVYFEDAIIQLRSKRSSADTKPKRSQCKSEEKTLELPAVKQRDDKFMAKRSKLENLLGNIKNKISCDTNIAQKSNLEIKSSDNSKAGVDSVRNTDEKSFKVDTHDCKIIKSKSLLRKNKYEAGNPNVVANKIRKCEKESIRNEIVTLDEKIESPNNEVVLDSSKVNCSRTDQDSEIAECSDPFSNLMDDDVLRDLENITIPVEVLPKRVVVDVPEAGSSKSRNFFDSKPGKIFVKRGLNRYKVMVPTDKLKIDIKKAQSRIEVLKDDDKVQKMTITSIEKEFSSPTSLKSFMSDEMNENSNVVPSQEQDSISDSNIHFIDEDSGRSNMRECSVKKDGTNCAIDETETHVLLDEENDASSHASDQPESNVQMIDENDGTFRYTIETDTVKSVDEKDGGSTTSTPEQNKLIDSMAENIHESNQSDIGDCLNENDETLAVNEDRSKSECVHVNEKSDVQGAKTKNCRKSELMTVYKIITNEYSDEIEKIVLKNIKNTNDKKAADIAKVDSDRSEDVKCKEISKSLNVYFKKCKRMQMQKKSKLKAGNEIWNGGLKINEDANIPNEVSMVRQIISKFQNETKSSDAVDKVRIIKSKGNIVKYCMNCSSIFYTNKCIYCMQNSLKI